MNIDRWLAVAGLVGTVISLWLAYRFYIKTIRTKLLAIGYTKPVSLMLPVAELEATYNGRKIQKLSRMFVLLWNRGTAPIESDDLIAPIKLKNKGSVLLFEIQQKDAAASVILDEKGKQVWIELLRPGEAIVLKIDVAEENFRPDISVDMKSADMSVILGDRSFVSPEIASMATALVVAVLGVVLMDFSGLDQKGWLTLMSSFSVVGIALGSAWLMFKLVQKQIYLPRSIPAWFFRNQRKSEQINKSLKEIRENIIPIIAVG